MPTVRCSQQIDLLGLVFLISEPGGKHKAERVPGVYMSVFDESHESNLPPVLTVGG